MTSENDKNQRRHNNQHRDNVNRQNQQARQQSPQPPAEQDPNLEPDDNIATPEEMEAFIRSRREQRDKARHSYADEKPADQVPIDTLSTNDSSMDPYLEPDPELPKVPYKESLYLWRGCNHCPQSYVPVSETELRSCCKVGSCNWMKDIRRPMEKFFDCVEVRFKNNRKDFYRLPDGIDVNDGDIVAVEGMPGHDVGIVSLTGEVCRLQMIRKKVNPESDTIKKLFRRAKVSDIERWTEALREEDRTLKRTRHIAEELGLSMKVNDVEYQGDRSKAIFYYTADERVDFRNLIKVLAEQFHVRIEMKQIGVRQEAGKVGGIGTCGRELCCSTWLTNFKSVTTGVAKVQQILPNPQKLAGQCGKLKCCLNFEYEVYVDALKKFPPAGIAIRFQKGLALYKKTDVFRGIMWYAYEGENDLYAITAENVKKLIEMNHNQQYPEQMEDYQEELMSTAALAQESSEQEFERALSLMADDTNASQDETKQADGGDARGSRRNDGRQERRGRGDKNDRDRRDNSHGPNSRQSHDNRNADRNGEPRKGSDRDDRQQQRSRDDRQPRDERQQPRNRDDRQQQRNRGNRQQNSNQNSKPQQ